jgi:excisionase family DNA binding protein
MKAAKEIRSIDVLVTARWLTIAEACEYARKSVNTLKRYIIEGKIYGSKQGGEWIVDRESIDSFYGEDRDRRRLVLAQMRRTA